MLLVNYESPDGAKRHIELNDRHGDLIDRIHAENIGCEYGEYS